jgi:hypothetical protein
MMDAYRYAVQATKELDFFGDTFFDVPGQKASVDYEEDWSGVWRR